MLNRGLDKLELLRIVDAVANEKSIDKELVIESMESAIQKAALTKFGNDNNIEVKISRDTGEIKIEKVIEVVEKVEDPSKEISLELAIKTSKKNKELIEESKQLIQNGVKEITLLGQNVNAYNSSNKKLSDLIIQLENLKGLERIRYTTSHPNDMTDDLIDVHGTSKKLMPHLHLPLQSGSTKILKSMNRNHSIDHYLKIIQKLKKRKPNIKFSSDFIIAYPGETEEDFNNTLKGLKSVGFINTHSFVFISKSFI